MEYKKNKVTSKSSEEKVLIKPNFFAILSVEVPTQKHFILKSNFSIFIYLIAFPLVKITAL